LNNLLIFFFFLSFLFFLVYLCRVLRITFLFLFCDSSCRLTLYPLWFVHLLVSPPLVRLIVTQNQARGLTPESQTSSSPFCIVLPYAFILPPPQNVWRDEAQHGERWLVYSTIYHSNFSKNEYCFFCFSTEGVKLLRNSMAM
jgi:hypothetical protein